MSKRIISLDWLRGIMAVAVMCYHYYSAIFGNLDASSILARLAVYAVAIFFILSGLSLAIVYHKLHFTIIGVSSFYLKRILRILPLLWICITLTLLPYWFWLKAQSYPQGIDNHVIFYNYLGVFGFLGIRPIAPSSWSIGNELVFYFFTPLIIYVYQKSKMLGNIVCLLSVLVGLYYCFFLYKIFNSYSIQPFNNFFLFVCGISMFYNFHNVTIKQSLSILGIVLFSIMFVIYPLNGEEGLVSIEIHRIVFSIISLCITFCFYKIDHTRFKPIFSRVLEHLGAISYSIYLLHIFVISFWTRNVGLSMYTAFFVSILTTIIISHFSYFYVEKKIMILSQKLIEKF